MFLLGEVSKESLLGALPSVDEGDAVGVKLNAILAEAYTEVHDFRMVKDALMGDRDLGAFVNDDDDCVFLQYGDSSAFRAQVCDVFGIPVITFSGGSGVSYYGIPYNEGFDSVADVYRELRTRVHALESDDGEGYEDVRLMMDECDRLMDEGAMLASEAFDEVMHEAGV